MNERIRNFLRSREGDGPCLVVDLEVVKDNYNNFAKALPDTRVFYAVKANPAPEVLTLLAKLGSCFDTASVAETEMALAAGATPDRISFGNTIKKERDIARAFALGVRLYAVDCKAEVEKVARAAPGSKVFCRILSDCAGAEWPLSRKFGCEPGMAVDVLEHALKLGLEPHGVSFHVGSQQRNQHAWDRALASAAAVFKECGDRGMNLAMVNLGGGFPTKYLKNVPSVKTYGSAIFKALRKHFGNRIPETIIEPGRGRVGVQEERGRRRALGLSRHRQVRWSGRDDGRVDPLPDPHPAGRRRHGALRLGGTDLRFGGRALREAALPAPDQSGDRR
jgi:ornithine decarboxylase